MQAFAHPTLAQCPAIGLTVEGTHATTTTSIPTHTHHHKERHHTRTHREQEYRHKSRDCGEGKATKRATKRNPHQNSFRLMKVAVRLAAGVE
jgi:hypothetical protein